MENLKKCRYCKNISPMFMCEVNIFVCSASGGAVEIIDIDDRINDCEKGDWFDLTDELKEILGGKE